MILEVLNKLKGTDFDELPELYRDFYEVNIRNKRTVYKNLLNKNVGVIALANEISSYFSISPSFMWSARGVQNIRGVMLRIIDEDPLKEYNLIPTISLMPLFLRKEDKVISFYQDVIADFIKSGTPYKHKSMYDEVRKNITKSDIFILPEAGSRIGVADSIPTIVGIIKSIYFNEDNSKILDKLATNKIYITNAVALNTQELQYYPSERIEFDKESVYSLAFPELLCILSAGSESKEVSVFIKTALSARHMVKGIKKTFIETALSTKEIERVYGLSNVDYVVL